MKDICEDNMVLRKKCKEKMGIMCIKEHFESYEAVHMTLQKCAKLVELRIELGPKQLPKYEVEKPNCHSILKEIPQWQFLHMIFRGRGSRFDMPFYHVS